MADHVYRVQIGWVAGSKNFGMNVFNYLFDDAAFPTPFAAASALANQFVATIVPAIGNCLANDWVVNLCSARRVSIPSGVNAQPGGPSAAAIVNQTGAQAGPTVSAALAAVIKWISMDPDNRMGRSFLGGFDGGAISDEAWQTAFQTNVASLITALVTPLVVAGANAVFSKFDRKTGLHYPIVDGQLNPKPAGFNKRTLPVT